MAALLLLAACSDQPADGYHWYRTGAKLAHYEWYVVTYADLHARCGNDGLLVEACAVRNYQQDVCRVYSYYDEAFARRYKPAGTFGGTTLFEHEVWDSETNPTRGHCGGWDHLEKYRGQKL